MAPMSEHTTPQHLIDRVRAAAADRTPLAITGGGSKAFLGEAVQGEPLSTTDWRGIVDAKTGQPMPCDDAAKRAFWDGDKPRVLALFQIVNTLGTQDVQARGDSFRGPEGLGAVVD